MPSTYSDSLRLELQATGENRSSWGSKINATINQIEDALAGAASVALADSNYTLTVLNGTTDESRHYMVNFSGALTAARTVTIPAKAKSYIFYNGTTGGYSLTISNGTNTVSIPNGKFYIVWGNGTTLNGFSLSTTISTFAETLLDDTDAAAMRTTLFVKTQAENDTRYAQLSGATFTGAISGTSGSFSTTLAVTGAATLSSTLAVTGAAVIGGAVTSSSGSIVSTALNGTSNATYSLKNNSGSSKGTLYWNYSTNDVSVSNATSTYELKLAGTGELQYAGNKIATTAGAVGEIIGILEDQKASGTHGGSATAGSWQTRDLNTEVYDAGSFVSITTNTFVCTVDGIASWTAPTSDDTGVHVARLYNVTDSTVAGYGTSEYVNNVGYGHTTHSTGIAPITAGKTYRVEHQVQTSTATYGYGRAHSFGTNVYTRVVIHSRR